MMQGQQGEDVSLMPRENRFVLPELEEAKSSGAIPIEEVDQESEQE